MNAIYVMWIRQLKRYSRSRARIIGSLGQPLLFLLALGFGFGAIYHVSARAITSSFLAPELRAMKVEQRVLLHGREHANRQRDEDGEDQRERAELERPADAALDVGGDRGVLQNRLAQIAWQQAASIQLTYCW